MVATIFFQFSDWGVTELDHVADSGSLCVATSNQDSFLVDVETENFDAVFVVVTGGIGLDPFVNFVLCGGKSSCVEVLPIIKSSSTVNIIFFNRNSD